jgi:hypothetical protein
MTNTFLTSKHYKNTEFLKEREQFLSISLKAVIVIVPLEEFLPDWVIILGQEEMVLVGLLLEPKGIDEFIKFLKILIVPEKEEDLIDVVF